MISSILQSFNTLRNYFTLRKYNSVPTERRLDKQCQVIQHMCNKLMEDAKQRGRGNARRRDVLNNNDIKELHSVTQGVNGGVPGVAVLARNEHQRSRSHLNQFAFSVPLVVAEMNGIMAVGRTSYSLWPGNMQPGLNAGLVVMQVFADLAKLSAKLGLRDMQTQEKCSMHTFGRSAHSSHTVLVSFMICIAKHKTNAEPNVGSA
jgi:hypothetical protein